MNEKGISLITVVMYPRYNPIVPYAKGTRKGRERERERGGERERERGREREGERYLIREKGFPLVYELGR